MYLRNLGLPKWEFDLWATIFLSKHGRGLYARRDVQVSERVLLARRYPRLTLALTSALAAQGVGEWPDGVDWWLVGHRDRLPGNRPARARFVRSSWPHDHRAPITLDGTELFAQTVARALVDTVRFRRLLGAGVAEASLRAALAKKAVTAEQLTQLAADLRVRKPMLDPLHAVDATSCRP